MIYTSARYMTPPPYDNDSMVEGTDANGNTETVRYDYTLFRQPDDGPQGFVNNGGVIAAYISPPTPPPTQVCPTCNGSGRIPL